MLYLIHEVEVTQKKWRETMWNQGRIELVAGNSEHKGLDVFDSVGREMLHSEIMQRREGVRMVAHHWKQRARRLIVSLTLLKCC
jgi:hypothetical protein